MVTTEKTPKRTSPKPVVGLQWVYLQYLLITGLYMVEPWERKIFNSFVLLVTAAGIALALTFSSHLLV